MKTKIEAAVCPNCGNTTDQEGISFCYLEWRICPVRGVRHGIVNVDGDWNETADVTEKCQAENTPAVTNDCEHFYCNRCDWKWHDGRLIDICDG